MNNKALIDRLNKQKSLSAQEFFVLIDTYTSEDQAYAASLARHIVQENFGKDIYFRGIIEFTNYCKNDCLYCGIRKSNSCALRYRLTDEDILSCCKEGYESGFRTFVLQGGEDKYYSNDVMLNLVSTIHNIYPDCAITLSIGELSLEEYESLYKAGATRYLLRHETADALHYGKLHPHSLSLDNRIDCLNNLKAIGYQTGCGFMVGSPYQTVNHLVKDMLFIKSFDPHMIGIGPFIPHKDTPFRDYPAGDTNTTLFLLSLCRIMLPKVLLPATTALGTLDSDGRKLGILAGCNVVMPNLSPMSVRKKYMLYNDKAGTNDDAASGIKTLTNQMNDIGYSVVVGKGDYCE